MPLYYWIMFVLRWLGGLFMAAMLSYYLAWTLMPAARKASIIEFAEMIPAIAILFWFAVAGSLVLSLVIAGTKALVSGLRVGSGKFRERKPRSSVSSLHIQGDFHAAE